jgi:protein-S-isoprenylcysteine O-methyltransferase Ste14
MKTNLWKTGACSLGYLLLAFACLVRWQTHQRWVRLDYFSGGYFILRLFSSIYSLSSSRRVFHSKSVMNQWWALDSDPAGPHWVMFLMFLDLAVFLDYGHSQLISWLAHPVLQAFGLALYLAVTLWQIWTDAYLARYFNQSGAPLPPMNRGPYRHVRHPRYAAAIAGKMAMALIFASLFGWILLTAWAILLLNKIAIEEKYLRKYFGGSYDTYSQTTAKVIPGIY